MCLELWECFRQVTDFRAVLISLESEESTSLNKIPERKGPGRNPQGTSPVSGTEGVE